MDEIIGYRQCGFRHVGSGAGQIFFFRQILKKMGVQSGSTSGIHRPRLGVGVTFPLNSVYENVGMKPVESTDRQSFDKSPVVKYCVSYSGGPSVCV